MSFSRRIGASPSIMNLVRVSELVMRLPPMTIRSNGFSSTFSAILATPCAHPVSNRIVSTIPYNRGPRLRQKEGTEGQRAPCAIRSRRQAVHVGAARCAEPDDGSQQRIKIAEIGTMIKDCRPDRQLALDHGRRRRRDSGFMNVGDNFGIDGVGVRGAIAKADDIELYRRQ